MPVKLKLIKCDPDSTGPFVYEGTHTGQGAQGKILKFEIELVWCGEPIGFRIQKVWFGDDCEAVTVAEVLAKTSDRLKRMVEVLESATEPEHVLPMRFNTPPRSRREPEDMGPTSGDDWEPEHVEETKDED